MNIKPINKAGKNKTGMLSGLTVDAINQILGFKPNIEDDVEKVENSWGFKVNSFECGVWDYNGSHRWGEFSTYGDPTILKQLFGRAYS